MDFFPGPRPAEPNYITLQSHMRLFLSADIVGSTAFKQRGELSSDNWFEVVMGFYREAELLFLRAWHAKASRETADETREFLFGEPPELWKTVGDEVIYSKPVVRAWQVALCLDAWRDTLLQLRAWLKKFDRSLDVKSTAWLADFPRNREIALRTGPADLDDSEVADIANETRVRAFRQNQPGLVRDFVGPSIDTGFRLSQFASPRKLVISLEVAHSVSSVFVGSPPARPASAPGVVYSTPEFYYDAAHVLKGVLGGAPYPALWIDGEAESHLHCTEDALLGRKQNDALSVHAFTTAFIAAHPERFCSGLTFSVGQPPASYQQHCTTLRREVMAKADRLQAAEENERIKRAAGPAPDVDPSGSALEVELPAGRPLIL